MADNALKKPFGFTIGQFAESKVNDGNQLAGQALPVSVVRVTGAIVTVKFEVKSDYTLSTVVCPIAGSEYIRCPTQVGDKGFVVPASARLGGVSGLGAGLADLSLPANLAALVFFPIGSKTWDTVDPNSVTIYGPNGVVLRDTGNASSIVLTPNGVVITGENIVTLAASTGESISVGSGKVQVTASGGLWVNGVKVTVP